MAIDTTSSTSRQCRWCGSAYRPSYFDGQYNCPACGRALEVKLVETPRLRPPRYIYAVAGLLIFAGFGAFALRTAQRMPVSGTVSASVQLPDVTPPFIPSEEFRQAVAKKANLLEQDLVHSPDDRFLLGSLAETYLYRALAEYQVAENPAQGKRYLRRASEYVEQLHGAEPFASFRLREALRQFPNLRFSSFGWPSVTASLWRFEAGKATLFAAPPPGGVPFIRRRRDVTGLPPVYNGAVGSTSGGPGSFAPPPPAPAPLLPAYPGVSSPPVVGRDPVGFPRPLQGPGLPRLVEPGVASPGEEGQLAQLRQLFAKHPDDLVIADRLVDELLRRSAAYQPAAPQNDAQLQARKQIDEAARICERVAATAPLRVQRAAFYASAADARRRLEQWEEQYALLRQAAEYAPFAPAVWHDLKSAALRIGKLDESLTASKKEALWRFPGVEPVDNPPRSTARVPNG